MQYSETIFNTRVNRTGKNTSDIVYIVITQRFYVNSFSIT